MSQHRQMTRNELLNKLHRLDHVVERDTLRMKEAARVIEEHGKEIYRLRVENAELRDSNERLKAVIAADTKRHEVPVP